MSSPLQWIAALGTVDTVLLVLVVAVLALLLLSAAFAAATVRLRVAHDKKEERWRTLEEAWEPLILDVLSGERPAVSLQAAVAEGDRLLFLDFLLRYHRRLAGDERTLLRELAQPHLPLLRPRLAARSAELRARAVQSLAELGLPEHVDALIGALDDESPIVEMIAARAILRKRVTSGYPEVMARLSHFGLWQRQFLASMLARGGPEVVPLLAEVANDGDQPVWSRVVALDALRELHDLQAIELAAAIARDESDRDLLVSALRTLEELGFHEHAATARHHLRAADEVVRAAAARALGALGEAQDRETLAGLTDDPSPWVALEAARGLSRLGGSDALRVLAAGERQGAEFARQVLAESGA